MECGKARKGKKKQVKDELDRIKQAEKKKRRLEKAFAASAAIIYELEKNQKKKEEQQRLDEECAAITEAVALQVLSGEESNTSRVQERYPWGSCDLFVGDSHARVTTHSRLSDGDCWGESGPLDWNGYEYYVSDVRAPYVVERDWEASEAISLLQMADGGVNAFVFNRVLRA